MTDEVIVDHGSDFLTYALDTHGKMVYIEDVPNGLACNCRCPQCHEPLIARNGGEIREHHFAHVSGSECEGAYETAFHLLAKEIISQEKSVMVPEYRHNTRNDVDDDECQDFEIIPSEQMHFESIEVEERNDASDIQPDCVGVTKDGLRVLIEIFVTHRVDKDKKRKILRHGMNCVEIRVPRNIPLDRERLTQYLLNDRKNRNWVNYPFADKLVEDRKESREKQEIVDFRNKHPECKAIFIEKCWNCNEHELQADEVYRTFIASYQDRILSWAVPILKLPPQAIIDQEIGVNYTNYNRIAYVRYNYRNYYIYPKGNVFENEEHKRRCHATYRLFKELYDFCQNYVNAKECHDYCSFHKACFEYRGQRYVFCSNKKMHNST